MERYEKGAVLGRGTFGSVYKAVDKESGKVVAIKKIDVGASKEGMHMTALREIKLLKELKGPHIVELLDVFPHKRKLTLVFEYMESDLEAVIKSRGIVLSPAHVKAYMQIILESLDFCHKRWVLHRDIKPNNMLVSGGGGFKLADFGLARIFGSPSGRLTNQVFARWYRPPELLFGSTCYGAAIDIWAVGCVFAELLLRKPWMMGSSDIDQLGKIFQALGTPNKDNWPGVTALPNYVEFKPQVAPPLRQQFPQVSQDALDLLAKLVSLDPSRRPTAEEALRHPYFTNDPPPTPRQQLPKPPSREDNPLQAPPAARPAVKLSRPASGAAEDGQQRPAKQARVAAASPAAAGAATAAAPLGGSDILGLGGRSPLVPVKS